MCRKMDKPARPAPNWRNPVHLLAFGLGAGASPWAPGTAGTLVAVPLYLILRPFPIVAYLTVTLALFALGVWLCEKTSHELGAHDHPGIVWDEIVGYLVTMILAPSGWLWVLVGFVLFRFFDILKPWPVRWADRRVGGGLGIMLDDLLAGAYGFMVLQIITRLLESP